MPYVAIITHPSDTEIAKASADLDAGKPLWGVAYKGEHQVVELPDGDKVLMLVADTLEVVEKLIGQHSKGEFKAVETDYFDDNDPNTLVLSEYCWGWRKGKDATSISAVIR